MKSKRIITVFLCLTLILCGVLLMKPNSVIAIENTHASTFSTEASTTDVNLEDIFSVSISLNTEELFKNRMITVKYDRSNIAYDSALTDDGEKLMRAVYKDGELKVNVKALNASTSKHITLNFKAINRGSVSISVDGAAISTVNNRIKTITASPSTVSVNIHDRKFEAFERIKQGTASLDDYKLHSINYVDADILYFVNEDIKGRNYTTKEEIEQRINENLFVYQCKSKNVNKIALGNASLADYTKVGITNVNEGILPYVNEDMAEFKKYNINEIKERINSKLSIYNSLKLINDGTAFAENYSNCGITNVNDYLLYYVNSRMKNSSLTNVAQIRTKAAIIVQNVKTYFVKGKITDSKSNNGVSDVTVKFKTPDGKYLTDNGTVVTTKSDSNGNYSIALPEGNYTAEVSKFYYSLNNLQVTACSSSENVSNNIVIVQDPAAQTFKAVLTWSSTADLDTYLYGTTTLGHSYTVSYGTKTYSENGKVVASLDQDITSGYGPETTTIVADYRGTYTYTVTKSASSSKGVVKLYAGNELIRTFNVPQTSGSTWTVFKITNGEVQTINTLS